MKKITTFIISMGFSLLSFSATGPIRQEIQDLLPEELRLLGPDDSREKIEERFSKKISNKEDSSNLYLNYFENKNDVTIGSKDGKVSYLYVELPDSLSSKASSLYQKVLSSLSEKQKNDIIDKMKKDTSHEKGRYIHIDLPEEGLKLEFSNTEKKELHSVIFFMKKGK